MKFKLNLGSGYLPNIHRNLGESLLDFLFYFNSFKIKMYIIEIYDK